MQWSIKELEDNIAKLFGDEQVKLVSPSLQSIFENQDFARYHYTEVNRLIKEHMDGKSAGDDYISLVLTNDNETRNSEYYFGISYKANIMALVKSLHSITDLLAHTIYYSLGLNLAKKTKIKPRNLNLYQVKEKLNHCSDSKGLISELMNLTNHENYRYLNALVNHSKHRSNITSKLTYALKESGADIYKLSFHSFKYDGDNYDHEPVDSYIKNEFDRQSELIIKIGNKINKLVASCS